MERRALTAGVNAVPDADPAIVRQFVTQEPRGFMQPSSAAGQPASTPLEPLRRKRIKPSGVELIGLIPVTVRLRSQIASALKRASLQRQLAGEQPFTQQDLVEHVLEPWLISQGYL